MQHLLTTLCYIFCTFVLVQSIDDTKDVESTRFAFTPSWTIDDMTEIINAQNGERFESDEFMIGNASWQILSFPNGNDNKTEGSYMVFLILLNMPKHWKSVTVRFTVISPQTFSRMTRIGTYDRPKGLGWWPRSLLLQELKDKNGAIKTLKWIVDINILRIITNDVQNDILYQKPLIYTNKYNLTWQINGDMVQSMKDATEGKVFEMKPNDINSTMWTLRAVPNGKRYGFVDLYLILYALPINVWSMKVKYTLKCLQTGTESKGITYFGYFDNYHVWDKYSLSLDKFRENISSTVTFIANIEIIDYYGRDGHQIITMAHIFELQHENKLLKKTIDAMEKKMNTLMNRLEIIESASNKSEMVCV